MIKVNHAAFIFTKKRKSKNDENNNGKGERN